MVARRVDIVAPARMPSGASATPPLRCWAVRGAGREEGEGERGVGEGKKADVRACEARIATELRKEGEEE